MTGKTQVGRVDPNSLSPELRRKLIPKKKMAPRGSFSSPKMQDYTPTQGGIGSKAKENAKMMKHVEKAHGRDDIHKKKREAMKKSVEDSRGSTDKKEVTDRDEKIEAIEGIIRLASDYLSVRKMKKIAKIIDEPDDICGQLGIKFDDEDLQLMIFKGEVEKDIDVFKNELLVIKIKTLTKQERMDVDKICNEAIRKNDVQVHTQGTLDKFRTLHLVAESVIAINGDSIGSSHDEKVKHLTQQSDWIYEYLVETFNLYIMAVNEALTFDRIKNA